MDKNRILFTFIRKAQFFLILFSLIRGILRFIPIAILGFVLLAGIDRWLGLTSTHLKWSWGIVAGSGVILLVSSFLPFRQFSLKKKSEALRTTLIIKEHPEANAWRQDEMVLAHQLATSQEEEGDSAQLKSFFLQRVEDALNKFNPLWCLPLWNWKRSLSFGISLLGLSGSLMAFWPAAFFPTQRVLFPFSSSSLEHSINIEPKDAFVPWGKDVSVRTQLKMDSLDKPVLLVRGSQDWNEVPLKNESGRTFEFLIKRVTEPLVYRITWKNDSSKKYQLTPTKPISIKAFQIKIQAPSYLVNKISEQESPEITALPGSKVSLSAELNREVKEAKIFFSDGTEEMVELTETKKFKHNFDISKELTYSFRFKVDGDIWASLGETYPIRLLVDQPPTITLLSPEEDLVVGEREKIPLTYDVRDDFGVQEVLLRVESTVGTMRERRIKNFEVSMDAFLGTFIWNMSEESAKSGQLLRYQLAVLDGNSVTGPGRAFTPWRIIEITQFDKEHALLERALEEWRDKTLDLLAKVNTSKQELDKGEKDPSALAEEFNQTAEMSGQLENMLKKIVTRMEEDPLSDYRVWMEHSAIQQSLSLMNQTTTKNAQAALQTKNTKAASNYMEQMASELERSLALSEDLSKTQKAKDVTDKGADLEKLGEDLLSQLNQDELDPKTKAEINRLLEEAQKMLMDIARNLTEMPQELPEDFVNQEALKNLDVRGPQDLLSQINEALKRGDASSALSMAQQFLKMARQMKEQLSEAHDSFLEEQSSSELTKKLEAQQKELQDLILNQSEVLAETQILESKRMESLLKAQSEWLALLAEKQRKVVSESTDLKKGELSTTLLAPRWATQIPSMEAVFQELRDKKLEKTKQLLPTIIDQLKSIEEELKKNPLSENIRSAVEKILKDEEEIWAQLSDPTFNKEKPTADEKQNFSTLKNRQDELQRKTDSLRKELQNLSRKTASLGLPLSQALQRASGEMIEAVRELSNENSKDAQSREEKALDGLLEGQSSLQQAMQKMGEASAQGGGGGAGMRVVPRRGSQGSQGTKNDKVHLPKAEDYRPPREFREDLLESLKEKYPKIYEDIIHKYYKRLSE